MFSLYMRGNRAANVRIRKTARKMKSLQTVRQLFIYEEYFTKQMANYRKSVIIG